MRACIRMQPMNNTVEPCYNKDFGTTKITWLYLVSHYISVKILRNTKSWDQQKYLVASRFCKKVLYIRPLYNEVPLYMYIYMYIIHVDLLNVPMVYRILQGISAGKKYNELWHTGDSCFPVKDTLSLYHTYMYTACSRVINSTKREAEYHVI